MPTLPEIMYPARMNPNLAAQGRNYLANMIPPESVMDPRYAAWKKAQDDAEALGIFSDIALTAIPFAGVAAKGAMAAGRTLAPTAGMAAERYMNKIGGLIPLDVYQGSPHKFAPTARNPLGEFDATKIGTGEGAQAYGYGHYLAESPAVASTYMAGKSGFVAEPMIGGKAVHELPKDLLRKWEMNSGGTSYGMLDELRKVSDPAETLSYYKRSGGPLADIAKEIEAMGVKNARANNLYTVDLPDKHIERMLDWDKPLSQQHPDVQAALKQNELYNVVPESQTGGDLHEAMHKAFGGRERPSEILKSIGIPGIRYLDQGSRGAGTGTRNFVVFPGNENILKILQRE